MKAAILEGHGDREQILYREVPDPEIGADEVLLAVKATAVNFHDIFTRRGMPGITIEFPLITGSDIAGEVREVGSAVDGWKAGDRVLVDRPDEAEIYLHGLVGEAREDVAVAEHHVTGGEAGVDLVLDVVEAVGGEEQRDGRRVDRLLALGAAGHHPPSEDLADHGADGPAGGLAGRVDAVAGAAEPVCAPAGLSGGARAVDALEDDEATARPRLRHRHSPSQGRVCSVVPAGQGIAKASSSMSVLRSTSRYLIFRSTSPFVITSSRVCGRECSETLA